jgi:integrase
MSLREAVEEYLIVVYREHPQATYMAYRRALKLFLATTATTFDIRPRQEDVSSLENNWAVEFLAYLQGRYAAETEHLYSRAVLDFYNHASRNGWTAVKISDLEDHYDAHRRPKRYEPPTPPLAAISDLLSYVQMTFPPAPERKPDRDHLRALRDRAFLLTLADTGLRISEICDLRLGQLAADGKTLRLKSIIVLSARAGRALHTYLTERASLDKAQTHLSPEALPIFARHDKRAGKRILPISRWTGNNIVDLWVKLALPAETLAELKRQDQQITPQTFRHYFVVTTLTATGDPEATQQLARHAHPATTRRYVRSIRQSQEEGTQSDERE